MIKKKVLPPAQEEFKTPEKPQKIGVRLVDLLIEKGILKEENIQEIIEEQKKRGERLSSLLVKKNLIKGDELASLLASELGIPYVRKEKLFEADYSLRELFPEAVLKRECFMPYKKVGNLLFVAMADPLNIFTIDQIKLHTKLDVKIAVATEEDIKEATNMMYAKSTKMEELIKKVEKEYITKEEKKTTLFEEKETTELKVEEDESTVIDLINFILIEAIKAHASDIHIEPFENKLRIRYRIDGMLYEITSPPPKSLHPAVVSRIKIMGRMDIAEKRLPQDGRAKVRLNSRDIDLRISTMPTTFGEKVAIRILDSSALCLDLTKLGFETTTLAVYEKNIKVPYGIILVTGPTGSGKTTTLYSTLATINSMDKNIITIEDPVEYLLEGINQVQVKPEIGLNFASALRTFVRQDPDIIMVGEIRDKETAEVAINAALTGHLVFSTMHTNDSVGTIVRLINMDIEPFLISSTLIMSVAQRLVRVICNNCKEPYQIPAIALKHLGIDTDEDKVTIYRGRGCEECMNIGYKGRTGIFEVMVMNEELKNAVLQREPSHLLKDIAIKHGMVTLRESAWTKVKEGITTIEEMLRITLE